MPKPINDDRPIPDPRPPTGEPSHLNAAIKKKWERLGGEDWGTLDPDVPDDVSMGDGRGWMAQFQARDLSLRVIVWTAKTGAQSVLPGFNEGWHRAGHNEGFLGYPTSDELPTHDGVGRFQTFEGGVLVWHPETGLHEVHGAINARYLALGGTRFGYPTVDESSTKGNRGRFNHFFDPKTRGSKSIYWTAETGARATEGLIRGHWASLKWEQGFLGYPTSDQLVAHDGVGRYQTFEGGLIVWHPETGAHEVHGPIQKYYLGKGGSRWGYPTTDQHAAPDKRAQVNHFYEVKEGHHRSVYWTPQHGAHELVGYIRRAWESYKGHAQLGYPTSDEQVAHDGVGRFQTFENATFVWHPSTGAFEVHGAIGSRYAALGGSRWGYPITNEEKTGPTSNQGMLNHFRDVTNGAEKTILWSKSTGAHEVTSPIRDHYAGLGWASSPLGYPAGAAVAWPEGGDGSRQQRFQHGHLLCRASDGKAMALASPLGFSAEVSPASGPTPLAVRMRLSFTNLWVTSAQWQVRHNGQSVTVGTTGSQWQPLTGPFTYETEHTFAQPGQYEVVATVRGFGRNGYGEVTKTFPISVGGQGTGGGGTPPQSTNTLVLLIDTDLDLAKLTGGRFEVTGPGAPSGPVQGTVELHSRVKAQVTLPKPAGGQFATYQVRASAEFLEKSGNDYGPWGGTRSSTEAMTVNLTTENRQTWFSLEKDTSVNDFFIKSVGVF